MAINREVTGRTPSPRSGIQTTVGNIQQQAQEPYSYLERWSYGIITDVNFNNYQVKVRISGDKKHTEIEQRWHPLITQQDEIFLRWGQLRKGMICRIHWRGRGEARRGLVEIIGDESANFLKQEDRDNDVKTRPYKFLGGGLTAF